MLLPDLLEPAAHPADFGILAVIAVIGAFQALLSSLSLDLAITRFYYEWPEALRRRNLGAIWTWNWIATLAVGVLFLLAFQVLGPLLFRDVPYDPWLILGIVGNLLANLFIIPASTIRIKRLPWLFGAYNLGGFRRRIRARPVVRPRSWTRGSAACSTSTIWANLVLAVAGGS